MSLDKIYGAALLLTIGCVVEGVTALHGVGCNLLCELGTVGGVAAFCTIGGETVIFTLEVVSLSLISSWGGRRIRFMPIASNRLSASILSSPT
jgi:hypothetical protein